MLSVLSQPSVVFEDQWWMVKNALMYPGQNCLLSPLPPSEGTHTSLKLKNKTETVPKRDKFQVTAAAWIQPFCLTGCTRFCRGYMVLAASCSVSPLHWPYPCISLSISEHKSHPDVKILAFSFRHETGQWELHRWESISGAVQQPLLRKSQVHWQVLASKKKTTWN